ncbi:MAG: maleylpyruvate isomerase N-terminal domain-containing protein [Roseovarius sp.]
MSQLDARREALKARQGAGARYDAPEAPSETLGYVRQGTAYFARILNDLSDLALAEPVRDSATRAHLVAAISIQARRMSETLSALRQGQKQTNDDFVSPEREVVNQVASLPPRALRNLFAHSEVHLNVEFRDLKADHWQAEILSSNGALLPVNSLPYTRAVSLWRTALELCGRGRIRDCPDRLKADLTGTNSTVSRDPVS